MRASQGQCVPHSPASNSERLCRAITESYTQTAERTAQVETCSYSIPGLEFELAAKVNVWVPGPNLFDQANRAHVVRLEAVIEFSRLNFPARKKIRL